MTSDDYLVKAADALETRVRRPLIERGVLVAA
jgi:hypothetical protein